MLYKSVRFGCISDYFLRPLPAALPFCTSRSLRLPAAPFAQLRILPASASSFSPYFSHSCLPRATAKGAPQPHLSAEGRDPPPPPFSERFHSKGLTSLGLQK